MIVGSEVGATIGTERSGEEVAAQIAVVDTTKPRQRVLGLTNGVAHVGSLLSLVEVFLVHIVHIEHTECCLLRESIRITGTNHRAGIALAGQYLVTGEERQAVVFAQALYLIEQRRSPTDTIAVTLRECCLVVRLVGPTGVPTFRLGPVAAERELGLSRKALDDVPGQGTQTADALTVSDLLVVFNDVHRIVDFLDAGTTHT